MPPEPKLEASTNPESLLPLSREARASSPGITGRWLGVDYGQRRVGLAISDPLGRIASPLTYYERRDPEQDGRYWIRLVEAEDVRAVLVGLPVHASGEEGASARAAREFGAWIGKRTGRPVRFWDERFTTVEAERHLRDAGLSFGKRRGRRDMLAAQILLQSFLDAGCPAHEGSAPLDDRAGA